MNLQEALQDAGFQDNHSPICPYCFQPSKLVTGLDIYPHRKDLSYLSFWQCKPCNAYVGCHKNSEAIPLGTPANKELRALRSQLHEAFDPIWQFTPMKRSKAYFWLAQRLNIDFSDCHIAMFDIHTCHKAMDVVKAKNYKLLIEEWECK